MNRFEQRLRARMENAEYAAGYRDMEAELDVLAALTTAPTTAYNQGQGQLHKTATRTSTRGTAHREGAPPTASAPGYGPGENHLANRSPNATGR